MNTLDYLLYGLLGLIIVLLLLIAIILLRRSSRTAVNSWHTPNPPAQDESTFTPELQQDQPQTDPLDKYLQHMNSLCQSVETLSGKECILRMESRSLPTTLEFAKTTKYYDKQDDYRPTLRLYFELHDNGAWEISDRGENVAALREVSDWTQEELDAFRQQLNRLQVHLDHNGVLNARGDSYRGFEQSLNSMRDAVETMDDHWRSLVWESAGLLPLTMDEALGDRREFFGTGVENNDSHAITQSFALRQGAIAIAFEHTGNPQSAEQPREVYLVRDNPGIFDTKMPVCKLCGTASGVGIWCVAEGDWRDPHPAVDYHLEVAAPGEWKCTILQPELGQSKGTFPHRAGLQRGPAAMGPFRTGARPTRARIQHDGSGEFYLQFISIDGTHEPKGFTEIGQFYIEDHELELWPGKEYLAYAYGEGQWEIELTQAY